MDRPLKEIKLKVSGYTAKVVEYLTRGEAKTVESKQWEGGQLGYVGDEVKIENIPVDYRMKQDDALLFVGVKELLDKNGAKVEITSEILDNLPDEDTRALLSHLNAVFAGLTDDKKK